ncbi:MAG: YggS family pyridoxal phosphate-dependent enzyme [Gammaproteobacteria bacterium]|nr:MAG: YggS family pyridoxal phosphate-dependent enzyme [Gammaproteobacteria bacterium]
MLMDPQNLPQRVRDVRNRIERAAASGERSVDCITLLAVSKAQPPELMRAAAALGVRDFGESYLQEALEKMAALREVELTWHFVGRLQANKTRPIAESFAWVHGVDRLKIAERLAAQRPYYAPPLNLCLQVNVAGETAKAGVAPADLPALAAAVAALPRVRLRGLMCIPPEEADAARQRAWFARLRQLLQSLNNSGARLDTLSMGMSADFEAAILEGATIVRVGSALFGPRPANTPPHTGGGRAPPATGTIGAA